MQNDVEQLSPAIFGRLADQLEETMGILRDWGVRVLDVGRLGQSVSIMRQIHAAGEFPTSPDHLTRVAAAVRDGQEFIEIGNVVPMEEPLRPFAEALQRAVGGDLGAAGNAPAQFQSELWVGAMLVASGRRTSVITSGEGKRPDFVVFDGTMMYPFEVKRPAGSLHAARLVRRASRQLRKPIYHGGALVVDLSDCLDDALSVRFGEGPPDSRPVHAALHELTEALFDQLFDRSRRRLRGRHQHIFGLVTFGRSVYWDLTDLSGMHSLRTIASIALFRGQQKTLRWHRARKLVGYIHEGVEASGHQRLAEVPIDFEPA